MDREKLTELLKRKGTTGTQGQVTINLDEDLPQDCAYVDRVLSSVLNRGRCAKILRNFMVAYSAGVPQRVDGRDHLFEPEAICQTIKVIEGSGAIDLTKGPFQYDKGPFAGLWKKHFFQASFLAENILSEIEREGVGIIYRKLSEHYGRDKFMGKIMDANDAALIAEAFSEDAVKRRAGRRASNHRAGLTGEHLIYAALPSGNIYLYASFHDEDPARIADCLRISLKDFPELAGVASVFD